ncbi:putative transcription elongation factor spt6 [Tuber indicum]|nr:putative transcription elongation factor spt6 [Tuber indicum]
MDMRDSFVDREAEMDDDDELDREEFDEDTGEVRRKADKPNKPPKDFDDSSEEEDDDDDEEAAKIREGFIVDDEEEDEEEEQADGSMVLIKKRKKKRRRSNREDEEEEGLDEDDLDLVLENTGHEIDRSSQSKFKRLKRGREDAEKRRRQHSRDLEEIFSDEEDAPGEPDDDDEGLDNRRGGENEFEDFIEEDEMSEDERGGGGSDDDMQMVRRRRRESNQHQGSYAPQRLGLREGAISDMHDIFGRGDEYDFALVTEDDPEQEEESREKELELKDVFEPSELAERMLTDEDNVIRQTDEPERFQLARRPFAHLKIGERELEEETEWISKFVLAKKNLPPHQEEPLMKTIRSVLEFIVVEQMEVPFIYQHRKDYLIHTERVPTRRHNDGETGYEIEATKLLTQDDLWEILELDLKFRAFLDKCQAYERTYSNLKIVTDTSDDMEAETGLQRTETIEQIQDLHDYIHFRYHSQLKDMAITNVEGRGNGYRRPGSSKTIYERIRNGKVYGMVRAFGLSAAQFAMNVRFDQKREYAEDPHNYPHVISDQYTDDPEFPTGESVLQAAKLMLAEELFTNPTLRRSMRDKWFTRGTIHVNVTEKGVRQIDEQHQYYEFKYLRNQTIQSIAVHPAMYLRMMKAEQEGYVNVDVNLESEDKFTRRLYEYMTSENVSDIAESWNKERKEVVDMAMGKFKLMFQKAIKDELRTACEDSIAADCRRSYLKKLDQAPYKPKALKLGEIPRVFAFSNGYGERGRDAIVGVFRDEDGRLLETVKFTDLKDDTSRTNFIEVLNRRKPDVIAVAGFSVQTHKLVEEIRGIVEEEDINVVGDEVDDRSPTEVMLVNDEVARLYQNSDRAALDHPELPPLSRYCVALAKYVQNPLLEYAALGKNIVSIAFHPAQQLLPEHKLQKALETAMVDMVNLVGVDLNEAASKPYVANLLQYVCGFGPRKAVSVMKVVQANGGRVSSRLELLGDRDRGFLQVVGPTVFINCASFLIIPHDPADRNSDYLDNTRVHPEDYDLGRKMAADALDIDEEDVATMVAEGGAGAVINELINGQDEKVNELSLEDYAEELERNFNQKKRATLETIRAELQHAYEELRNKYQKLSTDEIFTMLTGETKETLAAGMVVPVAIRRVTDRYCAVRLACGIDGNVSLDEMHDGSSHFLPTNFYHVGQTVQARIEKLNEETFFSELSFREDKIRNPLVKRIEFLPDEWDDVREERDKARLSVVNQEQTRTARVIKHPLFKPYNSRQAQEFLAGQSRGDAIIRPSSNGPDHIAVTWKVSDGIYQHIDVLELDKDNEFTVGKTLKVSGKFSYSDLDELIVTHVKAMAKKVDELSHHSKFIQGTKAEAEKWLEKYCEANPKRSMYGFCFDTQRPGYFHLLYKAGANARIGSWPVKIIPHAFQLRDTPFPDVMTLCNGFKTMFLHNSQKSRSRI